MYKISNGIKIFSFTLILLGSIGWTYSYMESHKTIDQVKEMLMHESSHGSSHAVQSDQMEQINEDHHNDSHESSNDDEHAEHVMHQIHNRPYAALYVAAFFFMMISLGALAFYAIQYASQSGWSPVLFRVMQAITYYLLPGALIVLAIAFFADKHLFIWMDPDVVAHDKLIQAKSGWLNKSAFLIRGLIFIGGWSLL